ncbi:MAG: uroporphyrinogen decarboxylase family protein [bacterium]
MGLKLPKDKTLVIPLLGAPGIQLSNTSLKDNLIDGTIQFKTMRLLIERFQPDGVFPFMDLTVEAEALGLEINFPRDENPSVRTHNIKTEEDLDAVKRRYRGISGRMPIFIRVVEDIGKNFSVINGAYTIGPFTLAGELMGVSDLSMNVILNPGLAHKFLEFTASVIRDYAKALIDAGAQTIAVLEPSAVMLSPIQFEEFSGRYFSFLVEELKIPLILHICGNTNHLLKKMSITGAVGLSLDSLVNLKEASKVIPESVAIIGNLDPVKIFLQSHPEEVAKATRDLLESMKGAKNFILSSGCDLPVGTPLENIEAFMKESRRAGA